jgi:hypothetical protein
MQIIRTNWPKPKSNLFSQGHKSYAQIWQNGTLFESNTETFETWNKQNKIMLKGHV